MKKRILVIDDDAELGQELTDMLSSEGYKVTMTTDTAEGEVLINTKDYDIDILDFKMSGYNGIELLKKVKQKNPKTKVIMVTGRPFIEQLMKDENVIDLVDGVISKPFKIENLLAKIKS
jgi:DNA-binding response OmpR family regulator